jgi:hypothetical protein
MHAYSKALDLVYLPDWQCLNPCFSSKSPGEVTLTPSPVSADGNALFHEGITGEHTLL